MTAYEYRTAGYVLMAANDLSLGMARKQDEFVRQFLGLGTGNLPLREMQFVAEGWTLAVTPTVFEPAVLVGDEYRVAVKWSMGLWPREQTLADMASWGWFPEDE